MGGRANRPYGVAKHIAAELEKLLRKNCLTEDELKVARNKLTTLCHFTKNREAALRWLSADCREAARALGHR